MTGTVEAAAKMALLPCPFCGGEAAVTGIRDGQQVLCKGLSGVACSARGPAFFHGPGGWAVCESEAVGAWNARALPIAATPADNVERVEWPDIGPDPMKGERPADRREASIAAVRAAYVKQQTGVPDQTALVWRWHIGALLEIAVRSKARELNAALAPAPRATDAIALEGYRAAVSWIAADSWDGCSDCIEILRAAASVDDGRRWSPDELAAALARLRDRAALAPPEGAGR